jgi:tetratricopeptide (TPR) repeat protein
MMTFAEYNARLCDKDLQEYFQYLLLERIEKPQDETIKEVIAELKGIVMPNHLNGRTVIELREQNKIAADLAERGEVEESVAKIQQVLAVYPEHYNAFYTLGIISFEQGNFANALVCFEQAFEFNPFFIDAILRIFDCSICLGDTSTINELLNKALTLQSSDPELLETKRHLEDGTFPERLTKYLNVSVAEKNELKQELLELKKMLESGNSSKALERLSTMLK